jgi:hypothetical protein
MRHIRTPDTLMVWTLTDEVIENPEILAKQFEEIHAKGFGGVATSVRCSRYTWNDPPARRALCAIGRLCRKEGIAHWIGPDPRFVSRTLITQSEGLTVLLFGNRSRADVAPHLVPVVDGSFTARCEIPPRHVHTLNEVAVEYEPLGIVRVYAVRFRENIPEKILDISKHARFFYNARDRYVEAFGRLPVKSDGQWKILAFFAARTNHVDYSNTEQIGHYLLLLRNLKNAGCAVDGVTWDEPGFTCTYGTLPFSPAIRKSYARKTGHSIERQLWKLALDAGDQSHVRVRTAYYQAIQGSLNHANRVTTSSIKDLWGKETVSGIHDTWHFESADMCDMNHGSLDLWAAAKTKTGGFVDLGGVDQLRDPNSPWYAHLATMNVIAASLGKISAGGYAYNNLWTVGDDNGEGWQTAVLSHCVDAMALFGIRWLAHAYGPVGTIGEEHTFLGSPFLPGYPHHSTWPHFPEWNRRLASHLAAVSYRLPWANVLILYPVETMYSNPGARADAAAAALFKFVLSLVDAHFQIDILSPSACERAHWSAGKLLLGKRMYDALLFPSPGVVPGSLTGLLRAKPDRVLFVGGQPERKADGGAFRGPFRTSARTIDEAFPWLSALPDSRRLEAPPGSWATLTRMEPGTIITLMPARLGHHYRGPLRFDRRTIELAEQTGLVRVSFPADGSSPFVMPPSSSS